MGVSLRRRVTERAHERHEERRRTGLPQERVVQQLESGGPLRRIAHEHPIEEPLQTGGNLAS